MKLFKTENISIDPTKETILFFYVSDMTPYTHIHGANHVIYDYLINSNRYNVLLITLRMQKDHIKNKIILDVNVIDKLFKRSDNSNYAEDNLKIFYSELDKLFASLNIEYVKYIIMSEPTLLLTSYCTKQENKTLYDLKNEFFDYISNEDTDLIEAINKCNKKIIDKMHKIVSMFSFMNRYKYLEFFIPLYLHERNMLKEECIFFVVDPTLYAPFYIEHKIPSRFLYFADDFRGNRKFEKFDIAQFQHIIYENNFLKSNDVSTFFGENDDNTKNLLVYASIFYQKGNRTKSYYQFIHELDIPDSKIYIPFIKNSANVRNKKFDLKNPDLLEFNDLHNDVINNPLVEKNYHVSAIDIPRLLKKYKYNLILRCVSPKDSLNFRPVLTVLYDSLPLLDEMYDPTNLQIPKEFNEALVVKNSIDIKDKVNYYNKNENERIEIIEALKKHFRINDYLKNPELEVKNEIERIMPKLKMEKE